ncbi:MAG: hypothetical protein ACYDG5_01515 [Dehalococcoidales bacterium]
MEKEEKSREKVLVPVPNHKPAQKKENAAEQNKAKAWKMPRSWRIY